MHKAHHKIPLLREVVEDERHLRTIEATFEATFGAKYTAPAPDAQQRTIIPASAHSTPFCLLLCIEKRWRARKYLCSVAGQEERRLRTFEATFEAKHTAPAPDAQLRTIT